MNQQQVLKRLFNATSVSIGISGTDFEIYIYNTIRRNYPTYEGWIIEEQLILPDGSRPDFIVSRKGEIAVIGAKAELSMQDIYQIDHYGQECGAKWAIIHIANDTIILKM